jgi:hypothetical protein
MGTIATHHEGNVGAQHVAPNMITLNIYTTASLEVPLYTAAQTRLRSDFRWGEGDLGGEVNTNVCLLFSDSRWFN